MQNISKEISRLQQLAGILTEIKVNNPNLLKSAEEESKEFEKIILKVEEEYPSISESQVWIKAYKIFKKRYGFGIGTKNY